MNNQNWPTPFEPSVSPFAALAPYERRSAQQGSDATPGVVTAFISCEACCDPGFDPDPFPPPDGPLPDQGNETGSAHFAPGTGPNR
jgi:hypothetical protein